MKIKENLLNFFFPKYCLNCEKLEKWLCDACFSKIKISKTACFLCKKENSQGKICPLCRYYQGDISKHYLIDYLIWSSSYKNKINKKLIAALKYGGLKEVTNILAQLLNNKIKTTWPNIKAELFYIPSSKQEEKRRAYNQTKLIAENLIKLKPNLKINHNLVMKKFKQKQSSKNIKKRWQNLNEFSYQGKNLLDKDIIIIDDLASSGATLNQVAKCFKSHKPKSIRGAVVFKS